MKIAFVQNLLVPYFGIMYISAILKKNGHATDVFVEGLHKDIVKDICETKPDIIGFYCITGEHQWMYRRAREIKKVLPDVPIIVGGPHPTYFPQMIEEEGIDIICRGDGEISVLELMNRLRDRRDITDIRGLWVKKDRIYKNELAPLVEDIDTLPYPDRDIYNKYEHFGKETRMWVCISRGCPFNCTFCYNAVKRKLYEGQKVIRRRSVDNIIKEIKFFQKKYPFIKALVIEDDNFALHPNFMEFCKEYKKINGPPFIVNMRADNITEEKARKLREANCYCVSMGLESGNSFLRNKVLNKNISAEAYYEAGRLLKQNGIKLRTSNMFFLPGETIKKAFETLEMNKKLKPDYAWVYPLQPYPGTEIYNYSVEKGYLSKDFTFDDLDTLGIEESPIKLKDGKKIKVLHRLFYYGLKIPGFIYLLKLLVYIPNNFIFNLLHKFSILITYSSFQQVNLFLSFKIALQAHRRSKKNSL